MNKHLWDLFKDSKYRVDFIYKKENKFVWKQTVDLLDNYYNAKEFIEDVFYNPCFPTSEKEITELFKGCEAIKVDIVEIATDKIVSSMHWWYK